MLLFPILQSLDAGIDPAKSKIHLATFNGIDDPLDIFFAGDFEEWQCWQTKPNFKRPQVVALINMPGRNHWLFGGVYDSHGVDTRKGNLYRYVLSERTPTKELKGRLVVEFDRPGRNSYLNAERWASELRVQRLYEERLSVGEFPGYSEVCISKTTLDLIVKQQLSSWRSALSAVNGVYVISDSDTGQLYVGSATGDGGIWSRWSSYAKSGHGGNKELVSLLKAKGKEHARHFQFAILETADTKTGEKEIGHREAHWKEVLQSRRHGYNAN